VGIPNASKLYNDQETNLKGYFREITLLDQQIGRLRKKLRSLNIEQNTLLFYSSDNGGLDQKTSGGRAKKGSIYEGGLRIPAILEWPARFSQKEINTPCISSDLYPTLLGIAGLKRGKGHPPLDGTDIIPIISGEKNKRAAMGFWHGFRNGQATWNDRIIKDLLDAKTTGKPNPYPERILKNVNKFELFDQKKLMGHAAWNAWPWKLHRIQTPKEIRFELYNLQKDPMESRNLIATQNKRVQSMTNALESWQKSVLLSWSGKDYQKTIKN
jgi:arylsulfatase A-like enzyme